MYDVYEVISQVRGWAGTLRSHKRGAVHVIFPTTGTHLKKKPIYSPLKHRFHVDMGHKR